MTYAIVAYIAVAVIWVVYFVWLGTRLRRAREH